MAVDNSIQRATGTDPLVPEPVAMEIIQGMPAASAIMGLVPEVQRVTMPTYTQRMRALAVLPHAYFVGGDTGLKQTTFMQWKNKWLYAEEVAVIVPISENYLDDANTPIWDQVRPRLVEAAGALVDAACIFGLNKPAMWGPPIYQKAVAAGNEVIEGYVIPGDTAATDLAGYIAYLGELLALEGYDMSGFVTRPGFGWKLQRMRSTDGVPIFNPDLQNARGGNIYGMPRRELKNAAWNGGESYLIGGDWSQAMVGIRSDIGFRVFTEGVISDDDGAIVLNLMQQDSVALRMTLRIAWQVANPANRLNQDTAGSGGSAPTESTTRWPWAVLKPAGYSYSAA